MKNYIYLALGAFSGLDFFALGFGLSPPLAIFFLPYSVPFREAAFFKQKNTWERTLLRLALALLNLNRSKSVSASR